MHFTIRAAALEDLRQIKELDAYLFEEDAYPIFVLRQLFDITTGLMMVAVVEGKVVGYAIGHYNSERSEAWLLSAGVLPDYRGSGIGLNILKALVEELTSKGAQYILLTVHPKNKVGIYLYEKLGFEAYQKAENYYFDDLPRIIMKNDLRQD